MQPIRLIVVGIAADGTPPACRESSRAAFWQSVRLAESCGAEIVLLTAMDRPVETEALLDEGGDALFPQLQQLHRDLAKEAGESVSVRSQISHGPAGRELIRTVLREQADLLIVGPGRGGTLRQVLFGSTALDVLRKCPCLVWVNRPHTSSDGDSPVSTIVAADDFSSLGERVLETAVGFAKLMDGRLLAMHALPRDKELPGEPLIEPQVIQQRQMLHQQAEQTLAGRLSATDHRTLPLGSQIRVEHNVPECAIPEVVKEFQAGLVVIGTLARSGIGGLLVGNTVERLISELSCSVLAVKPDGFKSPYKLEQPSDENGVGERT